MTLTTRFILTLLASLPWGEVLQIVRTQMERKLHPALLTRIDQLVTLAERYPAAERLAWVHQELAADPSLRGYRAAASRSAMNWAIETAIQRLRALQSPTP